MVGFATAHARNGFLLAALMPHLVAGDAGGGTQDRAQAFSFQPAEVFASLQGRFKLRRNVVMRKTKLWSGAAVLALAGVLAAPALAATHHRHHQGQSTPAERAQTKQLNLQQLAMAQGQAPSNMTASVAKPNATPEVSTPNLNTNNNNTNSNMSSSPTTTAQPGSNDESSQPVSPQTPTPDQKPATQPSSGY